MMMVCCSSLQEAVHASYSVPFSAQLVLRLSYTTQPRRARAGLPYAAATPPNSAWRYTHKSLSRTQRHSPPRTTRPQRVHQLLASGQSAAPCCAGRDGRRTMMHTRTHLRAKWRAWRGATGSLAGCARSGTPYSSASAVQWLFRHCPLL